MISNKFLDLCRTVQQLPYGRNANRHDFSLVEKEGKGSCSSKHAFLKQKADEWGENEVQLILGMYRMHERNTPKIGDALLRANVPFIPEAHCYLRINGVRHDFTSPQSNFLLLQNDILEELEIQPEQVVEFKINFHQSFIRKWLETEQIGLTFEEIWQLREACISRLSAE